MSVDFLVQRFHDNPEREAFITSARAYSYEWLLQAISRWRGILRQQGVGPGAVVFLMSDLSAEGCAALLALLEEACLVSPILPGSTPRLQDQTSVAGAEVLLKLGPHDAYELTRLGARQARPLYDDLRAPGKAGLILFSSGTTGSSKAAVLDVGRLLKKYVTRRHDLRTLGFLLFDHIGGLDTLFYCLSNLSCIVIPDDHSPESVCRSVAEHRVEVLAVSPTFLNLLILSGAWERHDLSSVKFITYGGEVMPEWTLKRAVQLFPRVTFLQKYGTTEVGTLRSHSKSSDSLWMRVGGEGYATRIVDGMLQIKADSAMLGYLNAPSPFTDDGWFITGDLVACDGDFLRILGRENDVINVGGQKVHPVEVETLIRELEEVSDVVVYGEKNVITGNIVCAAVRLRFPQDPAPVIQRIRDHCSAHLEAYKVPVRILVSDEPLHTERFKATRKPPKSAMPD